MDISISYGLPQYLLLFRCLTTQKSTYWNILCYFQGYAFVLIILKDYLFFFVITAHSPGGLLCHMLTKSLKLWSSLSVEVVVFAVDFNSELLNTLKRKKRNSKKKKAFKFCVSFNGKDKNGAKKCVSSTCP